MALSPKTRLHTYEIVEPIGAGGMGEVYRARDTKLGRDVAIKVLPDELARDEERLARFKREAKVLASLNHPNIAAIYGLEEADATHFLVLELVEGDTLAERIARGPVPTAEALAIATKIAEGLEEAHERGVVHRDLKPANVKITPDDKVKVLDFGLAKGLVDEAPEGNDSMSPTLTRDATRVGVILGTAAYMSPEQARGKQVDKRTDIFAFGSVLFEMLTGRKAFSGTDVSDVLASVIKLEPDWSALPGDVPGHVRQLIRRCLEKEARKRWRDIGDVRNELDRSDVLPVDEPRRRRLALSVVVAAGMVCLLAGIAIAGLFLRPAAAEKDVTRFAITLPAPASGTTRQAVAISPDGRTIAYTMGERIMGYIYVRALDQLESRVLPGTDNGTAPAFSPDGQWLTFISSGMLRKVALAGGSPVTLCAVPNAMQGLSWGRDGFIYFADRQKRGIFRVAADGGEPGLVVEAPEGVELDFPRLLPDGQTLLYSELDSRGSSSRVMAHLDTGENRVLIPGGVDARYTSSGHLVYGAAGSLQAIPFDVDRLEVHSGGATPLAVDAAEIGFFYVPDTAQLAVSDNGTLVYLRAVDEPSHVRWVTRNGLVDARAPVSGEAERVRLSPDGARAAIQRGGDIWIWDLGRGSFSRLTRSGDNLQPVWTPDGKRVVFSSELSVSGDIFWQPADGSGEAEPLTFSDLGRHADDVSPDGKFLVFHEHKSDQTDIWIQELNPNAEARLFLGTDVWEYNARVSPDGRWLAYISRASGRNEVYVTPFPSGGSRIPVSTEGGTGPIWARDTGELIYRNGKKIMAVSVEEPSDEEIRLGTPRLLFEFPGMVAQDAAFDVTSDGQRFVIVESDEHRQNEIHVVLNWLEDLRRLAPTTEN